jgi:hypothetical protein
MGQRRRPRSAGAEPRGSLKAQGSQMLGEGELSAIIKDPLHWDNSSWTVYDGSSPCWWRASSITVERKQRALGPTGPKDGAWDPNGTAGQRKDAGARRNQRIRGVSRKHAEAADRRAVLAMRVGVAPIPAAAKGKKKAVAVAADPLSPRDGSGGTVAVEQLDRIKEPLLLVKIDRAAGLPVRDLSGTSDPYAVVKVIDQREAGQEAEEHRTRVVHRTTAPVFDQNFAFRLGKVKVEKDPKLAQKLSLLQPFIAVYPQECMDQLAVFGPTLVLTPFLLKDWKTDVLHIDFYDADIGQDIDDEYMCSMRLSVKRLFLDASADHIVETSDWHRVRATSVAVWPLRAMIVMMM